MIENESLSDFEDLIPRNAPKSTAQNFNTLPAKPTVPDVSIVFAPPESKPIPYYDKYLDRTKQATNFTQPNVIQENLSPPRPTVPELSLIFEPSNAASVAPTTSFQVPTNAMQKQFCPTTKQLNGHMPLPVYHPDPYKPSLPFKNFSNFKAEYGSLISSIGNKTRKSVQFKTTSNAENLKNNNDNLEEETHDKETETEPQGYENESNKIVLEKLNSISELMISLLSEIRTVSSEMSELKNKVNAIENRDEMKMYNCCCSSQKTKHDGLVFFDEQFQKTNSPKGNGSENILKQSAPRTFEKKLKSPQKLICNLGITSRPKENPKSPVVVETFRPVSENVVAPHNNYNNNENKSVDRSLAMRKLAEKYLTDDQLNIYVNGKNHLEKFHNNNNGCASKPNNINADDKKCTDMSMATLDYLKKYKLMEFDKDEDEETNNENFLFVNDIKKGPKFI